LPKFQMETKDQQRLVTKVLAKKIIHENLQQGKQEVGSVRIVFRKDGIAGKGTFGVVQKVKILKITNVDTASNTEAEIEYLAMKTIQLKKKESRELLMLKKLNHENIINLRYFYFSQSKGISEGPILLNLLFDIQPTTFHEEIYRRSAAEESWTEPELSSFCLQLAAGLEYLHSLGIAHRDIKPRNVLLQPSSGHVTICDLGSACHVHTGHLLTSYICSRFYRAPELLLGARDYGVTVDVWSLGCVLAEMALLRPLLEGEDTGDQLAVIVELLGPPSEAELAGMGAEDSVLASAVQMMQSGLEGAGGGEQLAALLAAYPALARLVGGGMLVYDPAARWTAADITRHPDIRRHAEE